MRFVSQQDPIRVFVGHVWGVDDDYLRVFEYLTSARNFYYTNTSAPEAKPTGGAEAEREELRRQINAAEVVLLPAAHHARAGLLTEFQANFAKSAKKPVLVLRTFGRAAAVPASLSSIADEILDWNERAMVDALRRHARHEDPARWDTIDFSLD
jgi:hypothetical protein